MEESITLFDSLTLNLLTYILQFSIFSDKLLAPDMPVDTVAYATFNYNLQTAMNLDFMQEK